MSRRRYGLTQQMHTCKYCGAGHWMTMVVVRWFCPECWRHYLRGRRVGGRHRPELAGEVACR